MLSRLTEKEVAALRVDPEALVALAVRTHDALADVVASLAGFDEAVRDLVAVTEALRGNVENLGYADCGPAPPDLKLIGGGADETDTPGPVPPPPPRRPAG